MSDEKQRDFVDVLIWAFIVLSVIATTSYLERISTALEVLAGVHK